MTIYSFDEFTFNCETLTLQKNGTDVTLRHQPAKLLKHLLEAAPGIVSRQTLQSEIWNDGVNVEFEQSLNACVNQLRSVLGDQARNARFIETLPKRGYRFMADIEPVAEKNRSRVRPEWLAFAAFAIGAVLLLGMFSSRAAEVDPVSVYVAPIGLDFAAGPEDEDAIQYVLRLGIVERLARYDRKNFVVINGESLWEDIDQTTSRDGYAHDYLLLLNLRAEDAGYSVDVVLSAPDRVVEIARTTIPMAQLSPDLYADAAKTVSMWTANSIQSGEDPVARPDTTPEYNTAYYRNMLNGQRTLRFGNRSSLVESVEWFEKALMISPEAPDALAGKAMGLAMLAGSRQFPEEETYEEIFRMADTIERNVGVNPHAQLVRGIVYLQRDWDIERAKAAFMRASQLAPGDARILSWKSAIFAIEGDIEAALKMSGMAVSMDPMSQVSNSDRCWYLNAGARFSEAVQFCDWALEVDPNHTINRLSLVLALYKSGQPDRAAEVLQPVIELVVTNYGGVDRAFDIEEPNERLREMYCYLAETLAPRAEAGAGSNYTVASFWAMCGKFDVVHSHLQAATDRRELGVLFYELDAHFAEYRASLIGRQAENTLLPGVDSRSP